MPCENQQGELPEMQSALSETDCRGMKVLVANGDPHDMLRRTRTTKPAWYETC